MNIHPISNVKNSNIKEPVNTTSTADNSNFCHKLESSSNVTDFLVPDLPLLFANACACKAWSLLEYTLAATWIKKNNVEIFFLFRFFGGNDRRRGEGEGKRESREREWKENVGKLQEDQEEFLTGLLETLKSHLVV